MLSVLVPTIEERAQLFNRLKHSLNQQIELLPPGEVELLSELDDRTVSIGEKRNLLINAARGDFVVFIDDDDHVASDYLALILTALRQMPDADCVGHRGEISFRGRHTKLFEHSIRHCHWGYEDGRYVRPPAHISPIRRSIATRYRFQHISYSEDIDWVMRIHKDNALKKEAFVTAPIYTYRTRRFYSYQWLLDRTQRIRRGLGLEFVSSSPVPTGQS